MRARPNHDPGRGYAPATPTFARRAHLVAYLAKDGSYVCGIFSERCPTISRDDGVVATAEVFHVEAATFAEARRQLIRELPTRFPGIRVRRADLDDSLPRLR